MNNLNEFIDRYVAVWNEPDADRRRQSIAELWTEDSIQFTSSLEARGHEALEARITNAYEQFVRTGGFIFKSTDKTESHHNLVKLNWIMVPATGGAAAAAGVNFLILDENGRIRGDYQFTEPLPSA